MIQAEREIPLPKAFILRMKALLKEDFESYLDSFHSPKVVGLRANTSKISPEALMALAPFELVRIPWTTDGFYVPIEVRPAKHPMYHAGLYYLQEPSAMAPVSILNPNPGDYILDICAAPGGKTLQLANRVGDLGVVVSNDISASRLRAVIRNVEMFGLKNVIVISSDLEEFCQLHRQFYDGVLLDAPCSGEGMFRKDADMANFWTEASPREYSEIQKRLIGLVDIVLKPGGKLMYSTCTFSEEENEAVIVSVLENSRQWRVLDIGKCQLEGLDLSGFREGLPHLGSESLLGTRRLYPFALRGEGHYVALLENGDEAENSAGENNAGENSAAGAKGGNPIHSAPLEVAAFMREVLNPPFIEGNFRVHGDKVMLEPAAVPELKGVRVLRRGWYLGDLAKGRFEPAPSFAMGLKKEQIKNQITFSMDSAEVVKYLKCETLSVDVANGTYVVCMDDYPLGWAKVVNGQLKNKYPAAWRMM